MYDVFDFVERQLREGGRILIHCSQGVSRSVALAISYLMWKQGRSYDEVFAEVKAARGVANPNIGFICQVRGQQRAEDAIE
jgi:protein-tyrosine phosphatase